MMQNASLTIERGVLGRNELLCLFAFPEVQNNIFQLETHFSWKLAGCFFFKLNTKSYERPNWGSEEIRSNNPDSWHQPWFCSHVIFLVWNLTFHPVKIANFVNISVILSFWPQWCKHKALSSPSAPCCLAVHASISALPRIAQRVVITGEIYSLLDLFDRYLLTTTDMFCTVDDFKDT